MALAGIRNHRNFFSDYWLGTLLGSRRLAAPRLTAEQLRRRIGRLSRLVELAGTPEGVDLTRFRERFARPLLGDVFDFTLADGEPGDRIHAVAASDENPARPLACIRLCPGPEEFDSRAARRELEEILLTRGLDHGFLLSPECLRLIRAPGIGGRGAAFDLVLPSATRPGDESLAAAYRILSARSFTPDPTGRRPIDLLEAESREHSAKVSSELKGAVFEAAERIVGAFAGDATLRSEELGPVSLPALRDAGFLALYRLLFILYAEARDERLAAHRLYQSSYALEPLVGELLAAPLDLVPGNRERIWSRLKVLFRVFNDGLNPNLPDLENIPPRGGRLFSNETPEGTLLNRLKLYDRACAAILLALATTRPRRGIGRERVSFRELEIEQLGAVYEGLLEYEPEVATETLLGVRIAGQDLMLAPGDAVLLCERKGLVPLGDLEVVAGTAAERLHPDAARQDNPDQEESDQAESEAGEEEQAEQEVEEPEEQTEFTRGAAMRLLRRIEPGTFFFRPGSARKASGSFYTPTAMVDYLVREALEPMVAGRSPRDIEALRIIDPACGSAHFLVGAARFLGTRLHQAYQREQRGVPPPEFHPNAPLTQAVRARWEREGAAWCRRRIVERCLYGVDLNPAAVQLAQVALWIESLAGDRPLGFFAHHIRAGHSLLGTWIARFDRPPDPQLEPERDRLTLGLFETDLRQRIEAALEERRLIDAELPPEIRADSPEEYAYKEDRLMRSEARLAEARLLLDLRSASPFVAGIWRDLPSIAGSRDPATAARQRPWWAEFERVQQRDRYFHWELEFPEVLLREDRPGFDLVLGNPPWDKVLPSKLEFYGAVDPIIRAFKGNELDVRIRDLRRRRPELARRFEVERERTTTIARVLRSGGDFPLAEARSRAAHEDLAKYFMDRALRLVRQGGAVGLVVPSVIYNGDGAVGIRRFLLSEARIERFYGFENRRRIFPIDSRYKFVNLVARRGADGGGGFTAAFMRRDVAELESSGPKPWEVRVTVAEVERLSPRTLAFLEYRGPRDQEIVARMHSAGRPTLGGEGLSSWGTRLISWRAHEAVFNTSEDKDLFTDPATGRLHAPGSVLARVSQDPGEVMDRMRERGFWPVFEGKHVDQFLVGVKPVRWWLSVEQAERKYGRPPRAEPTLVFRETASNTNERTCIAAVLPARSAASHKLTGVVLEHVSPDAALAVLNSFCFDFALRLRTAGTNVSFTYILPVAVPPASVVEALPRFSTRLAWHERLSHVSADAESWPALWQANRAVAEAYGLGPEELAHVMAAFPVFARKRSALFRFFQEQLATWAAPAGG